MTESEKATLLSEAKDHVSSVRHKIADELITTETTIQTITEKIDKLPSAQKAVQYQLLKSAGHKLEELKALHESPYFTKCEVQFDNEETSRIFYFSKQSLPEQTIYSWVSPAASIRFEEPGPFSYTVDANNNKSGTLIAKDQYLITDGKIMFMATESLTQPRELVYQDYFSQRKTTFALPEIVEQMEKAQDKVIRAHPKGSFLISGPAGSGKTTLALHRVAYLIQSPDTAHIFNEGNVMVFVQDASTKAYFGTLLPQLGITGVTITTFADWVKHQLKLFEYKLVIRPGRTESEADTLEFEKNVILNTTETIPYLSNPFKVLDSYYANLSQESQGIYSDQRKHKLLDRFDLTLLMKSYLATSGGLFTEEVEYKQLKGGKLKTTKVLKPLKYALMILDEVQNYLPEQINILKSCINEQNHSIVYVGDLAQQTQLCTIRDWNQAGENFTNDRKAILQKNYRSTKEILQFIKNSGFTLEVPENIKSGQAVAEKVIADKEEELAYVTDIVAKSTTPVGILAKDPDYLTEYQTRLKDYSHAHVMSISESQGVEFDIVCVVGINKESYSIPNEYDTQLATERKRVNKDLLYVALTRAMNELYVSGDTTVNEILKQ